MIVLRKCLETVSSSCGCHTKWRHKSQAFCLPFLWRYILCRMLSHDDDNNNDDDDDDDDDDNDDD